MKVLVAPSALLAGVLACTVAETAICGRCQPIPQRLTMTIRASPTVLPSLHAVQDGQFGIPLKLRLRRKVASCFAHVVTPAPPLRPIHALRRVACSRCHARYCSRPVAVSSYRRRRGRSDGGESPHRSLIQPAFMSRSRAG